MPGIYETCSTEKDLNTDDAEKIFKKADQSFRDVICFQLRLNTSTI